MQVRHVVDRRVRRAVPVMLTPYEINHTPSGDWCEAETLEAAHVAARTLIEDNDFEGSCTITRGIEIVGWVGAGKNGKTVTATLEGK